MSQDYLCLYCSNVVHYCKVGPIDDNFYYCEQCDVHFLLPQNANKFSLTIFSRVFQDINYVIYLLLEQKCSEIMIEAASAKTPINQRWKGERKQIKFNFLLPVNPNNVMRFIEHKLKLYLTFS